MIKRAVLAILAVFVLWTLMDFVIHDMILGTAYQATAALWRPMEEMIMWLIYLSVLISSIVFVFIYARYFAKKGISTGIQYGLLYGLAAGISMGYGTYAVMPIPYHMALTWFLGTVAETILGGILTAFIVKE
jgi:hypothetical protein